MRHHRVFKSAATSCLTTIWLLNLILVGGCSGLSNKPIWQPIGEESEELAAFDQTMQKFMTEHKVSCGALAVTYRGRLVLARGYNWSSITRFPVGPDTLFRIASLSKPITAAAVLHLVEQGKLNLDEHIVGILDMTPPAGREPDPRLGEVTVRHLLQHLGGWDRNKSFDPMFIDQRVATALDVNLPIRPRHIIKYMNGQPLQHDPGTTYAYSNYGYCLLGRIIEERSGRKYEDYVKSEILAPLGITQMRIGHSTFEQRFPNEVEYETDSGSAYDAFNVENMDAHGGWLASAVDLARFAAAFDNPDTCPILSRESIETMFALPENIDPNSYKSGDACYGCGWNVRDYGSGKRNTWHTGSLPGTYTFLARWAGGVDCAILFNKRGSGFNEIDGMIGKTSHTIKDWPQHNLFDK